MFFHIKIKIVFIAILFSLAACGGGGGGNDDAGTPANPGQGSSPPNPISTALYWSDPATWGGNIPSAGDAVSIPSDTTIILDVDTPALAGLTINGSLEFDDQDVSITADWIMVHGSLSAGSESSPYSFRAVITLTGDPSSSTMPMETRGIMVMGGVLDLHGSAPAEAWTKIDGHINAGATEFTVLDNSGWNPGDQLVLAPTDFYGIDETEQLEITAITGNQLSVSESIASAHWGLLQYITSSGVSLTADGSVSAPSAAGTTPMVLDERAEVGNLTRNIIIQSVDDALWQNEGFGAHVMVMTLDSEVRVEGVEFRRVGQAGVLGRYPFHWHRLSYDDLGNELGDASGHYLRNSSIHDSANRCITIHGTNGVLVRNNICFDILGHGIFFEDAVERRNTIENNLVLRVRNPTPQNALKLHETNQQSDLDAGSSGIWLSNPDNTVVNNVFADSEGFGLWLATPASPVGLNHLVPLLPFRMTFGNLDGNTMHSNGLRGAMLDNAEISNGGNEDGTVAPLQYASTVDGLGVGADYVNVLRFTITGWSLWKNSDGNLWDRAFSPSFEEVVSADSAGKYFAGAGANGVITRALIIGTSLNNASLSPHASYIGPPTAFATYHSAFDMRENIIAEFPFVDDKASGAFATDDYYLRPVDKGHIRNPNNVLINSHPGYRSDALVDEGLAFGFAQGLDHFVFAGALWDPQGIWGAEGNWNVYDQDFFTHNANCSVIAPASQNASSCDGLYYGVNAFVLERANAPYEDRMAIEVTRRDEANLAASVGAWSVAAATSDELLSHMRHFAARQDGIYQLEFPGSTPTDVSMTISNMHDGSDAFVLGVEFSGSEPAQVYSSTWGWPNYEGDAHASSGSSSIKHNYSPAVVGSLQGVIDSPIESYWQDVANNIVWIKVSADDIEQSFIPESAEPDEFTGLNLYNPFYLRIW